MNTKVVKTIVEIALAVLPIVLELMEQENGEGKQTTCKQTAQNGLIFAPSNKQLVLTLKNEYYEQERFSY